MTGPTAWQITVHPLPSVSPDPHGYVVATFSCRAAGGGFSATGQVVRGPDGLNIAQLEMESSDWSGLKADMLRKFPMSQILAHVRATPGVVMALPPAAAAPGCPCKHHTPAVRKGGRAALPDEHLRDFARAYLAATGPGQDRNVLDRLAAQYGRPRETIRTWLAKARRDGWLGPGASGRAGSEPGPRLIAAREA